MVDLIRQVAVHLERARPPHQARGKDVPDDRSRQQKQEVRKSVRPNAEQPTEDDGAQSDRKQRIDEQPQPPEHGAAVHLPQRAVADEAKQPPVSPHLGHRGDRTGIARRGLPPFGHILSIVALSARAKYQTPPKNVTSVTASE